MKVITRKYKLEKWKAIITNQMASGLTAAEYCRQEDLPISTFFYWKRTIRQELIAQMDTQVSKPAIVEVPLTVSGTSLEEAPPASPATPIEQNKLTTDMRKAINGLAEIVQNQYNLNPYESAAFLFCGRKADRMKCLYWDGTGFLLLYKRLENGQYQWPKTAHEVRSISEQQLRWLLEGLVIDQPKAVREVHPTRVN